MHTAVERAPVKPFRNSIGARPPEKKRPRPANLGEAREMIAEIYADNKWDEDEVHRYHKSLGIRSADLKKCSKAELILIVDDLERSLMVLLEKQ